MVSQPRPGPSTQGTAGRAPPLVSVEGPVYRATLQKCVVLLDWWLVRGEGDEIRVAGYTERERNRAARVFTSSSITLRHDDCTLETADQKILLIRGPLNNAQMELNGFTHEVSKYFQRGFPHHWESYANPNPKQMNENTQPPLKSPRYYIDKFLGSTWINSADFIEDDFKSSKGPTANTDGPSSQRLSDFSSGTARIQEPSGNSGDHHHSVSNTIASKGLCNGSMGMPDESFEDPGPGETCSGQTSQAAKHRKLEVLAKGLNPAFGLMQCSKENTGRTLRSGKVCEMSNGASVKKGHSKRTVQQETLNMKVIPTEETTPPSDPTCHKNGGPVAQITAADKLQSKDLAHKGRGRGRPRMRVRTEEGGSVAQITAADKLQSKDLAHKGRGRGRPRKRG